MEEYIQPTYVMYYALLKKFLSHMEIKPSEQKIYVYKSMCVSELLTWGRRALVSIRRQTERNCKELKWSTLEESEK